MSSVPANTMHAFNRFGLGARPDDPIPTDPTAWLLGQLRGPDPMPTAGLPSIDACMATLGRFNATTVGTAERSAAQKVIGALFQSEVQAFLANAVQTRAPFRERLVWFWSNHFAIQADSVPTQATAGVFVRDAIRPFVTGSFADMLVTVVQHPAMLFSLNNNVSIGPGSVAALRARKMNAPNAASYNINENLGRELLELHTVGVNGGYTQADVDALAYLLTGFTASAKTAPLGFVYNADIAQPGTQTLMSQQFANTQAGCIAALRWLATRPATYQRLATKLATHFISDAPPADAVQAIYAALAGSGGNLGAAAAAVVGLQAAWLPYQKLRTPLDLVIAAMRALGSGGAALPALQPILTAMGQPTWQPPFPNGWSDLTVDWTGPEASLTRVDWANTLGMAVARTASPAGFAACALGPLLGAASASVIAGASAPADQLALLISSPEFQRR